MSATDNLPVTLNRATIRAHLRRLAMERRAKSYRIAKPSAA